MVELTRDDDPLGYRTTAGRSWPEGTAECAADLDRLGLPVGIGGNAAMRELTNAQLVAEAAEQMRQLNEQAFNRAFQIMQHMRAPVIETQHASPQSLPSFLGQTSWN